MENRGIEITETPGLNHPLFITGFDGWGNALNISKGMMDYLISRLSARPIAHLNPDFFYRYDGTRPVVRIEEGGLKSYPAAERGVLLYRDGRAGPRPGFVSGG